jgi:alkaline phosphatase
MASAQDAPTRVILLIADGAGTSYWTAAAFAADDLAVKQFPVMGLVETRSSDSKVTDSAAAATAYAAGVSTYNGAIAVDPDTNSVTTVLEVAQSRGMATGLVATSSITHATPAAFAAHVADRDEEWEIARQLSEADVDVVLGGGRAYFESVYRPDQEDLLAAIGETHEIVLTPAELHAIDTDDVDRLFGLFSRAHMPSFDTRWPTLPEMTAKAIEVLDKDPDGFFLMVEGSQPDWRGHDNAPMDAVTAEMLDFDRAIAVALEYQEDNPETLIIVTADHETGGLAVQLAATRDLMASTAAAADTTARALREAAPWTDAEATALADSARYYLARVSSQLRRNARRVGSPPELVARYTTGSHTAEMVPLFASGPGAERFGGIKENWRIGELLLETVKQ